MRIRFGAILLALASGCFTSASTAPARPHNVVIFVADGLRYSSVTPETAPTLFRLKSQGVDFTDSHALYPTLTTANASAIATGHYLGDTGDYANVLFTGFPVRAKAGATVVFLEDDAVLAEMKQHFANGYMGPTSLICAAQAQGFATAIAGKLGPAAIQGLGCLTKTIVIDDVTGRPSNDDGTSSGAIMIDPALAKRILAAAGTQTPPKSGAPNTAQQDWLVKAATQAVLPALNESGRPFILMFWSRDPDGSQHGEDDAPGTLIPGINGPTAHAGIADADSDLKRILDALAGLGVAATTDVVVTADHGFSTIAKSAPDARGILPPPSHPIGFVALDVASWLQQKMFDPDAAGAQIAPASGGHPSRGNALIGPSADAPVAVVAANGGSDLIYLMGQDAREHAQRLTAELTQTSYAGSLFVNDTLMAGGDPRDFAGALPFSAIGLLGRASVPLPAIIVGFRFFVVPGCTLGAELCTAEIADTSLGVGQGMHGSFSRADTRNFMAAAGPDFKAHFADTAAVGNADVAPTLAHILNLSIANGGALTGRIASEALAGGEPVATRRRTIRSPPAGNGFVTEIDRQEVGNTPYFDAAGDPGRSVGLSAK